MAYSHASQQYVDTVTRNVRLSIQIAANELSRLAEHYQMAKTVEDSVNADMDQIDNLDKVLKVLESLL